MPMDPLAALLSERSPQQLSETELRSRIALLEDAARACRAELESRTRLDALPDEIHWETRRKPSWFRLGVRLGLLRPVVQRPRSTDRRGLQQREALPYTYRSPPSADEQGAGVKSLEKPNTNMSSADDILLAQPMAKAMLEAGVPRAEVIAGLRPAAQTASPPPKSLTCR